MTMPNFLVIGSMRCGTTSLYQHLNQHPEVYMSPAKEPGFFAFEGETLRFRVDNRKSDLNKRIITDLAAYRSLFDNVTIEKAVGEASPFYIYIPKAAERIHHHIPDAKLICVLRNPIDRAYSSYLRLVRRGVEIIPDFAKALDEEEQRIRDNWALLWHYKRPGFYCPQLSRYFDLFDRGQIRVFLYEDLRADTARVLGEMFGFLGVDDTFAPDVSKKYNISGVPRNRWLDDFLAGRSALVPAVTKVVPLVVRHALGQWLTKRNLTKPVLTESVRRKLIKDYREDILELEELIERDLTDCLH